MLNAGASAVAMVAAVVAGWVALRGYAAGSTMRRQAQAEHVTAWLAHSDDPDARGPVLLLSNQSKSLVYDVSVARRADAPELREIHRFTNEWEKEASLALSRGDVQVISTYGRHKRIRESLTDEMVDAAYVAWRADCAAGRASILVTESARDVRALNERARAERLLLDGAVDHREVDLVDGCRASVGDVVITRQNDRRIRTMRGGWVKNGDR